jgi:hypothetical protein
MQYSIADELWDCSFTEPRPVSEWLLLLNFVADSFSKFLSLPVVLEDISVDDERSAAHCCVGGSIHVPIVESIGLRFCGSLDISVNRHESVSVRALLLLFCNNKRLSVHPGRAEPVEDWYWFHLERNDHTLGTWRFRECTDESGEWETFMSLADWLTPQ